MENKFTTATAEIRGGDGLGDGGILGSDGQWYGHYWVHVATQVGERYVMDITCDQFGYGSVFIEKLELAACRYRRGDQVEVDIAVRDLSATFGVLPTN